MSLNTLFMNVPVLCSIMGEGYELLPHVRSEFAPMCCTEPPPAAAAAPPAWLGALEEGNSECSLLCVCTATDLVSTGLPERHWAAAEEEGEHNGCEVRRRKRRAGRGHTVVQSRAKHVGEEH